MPKPSAISDMHSPRYGFWPTELSAAAVIRQSHSYDQVQVNDLGAFWRETRPDEEGRSVICMQACGGETVTLTPLGFSANTRVHEYGGGDWCLGQNCLFFVNDADQQIYQQNLSDNGTPKRVTNSALSRFADLVCDYVGKRIICVEEKHSGDGEPTNSLVSVCLKTQRIHTLAEGHDFYSSPTLNSDCTELAWLTWDHPHMPWVSTQLHRASLTAQNSLHQVQELSTSCEAEINPVAESLFQPEFSQDGQLYCVTDRSGWWNLHRFTSIDDVRPVWEKDAEFGLAQWQFGLKTYDFLDCETIVCSYLADGEGHLVLLQDSDEIQRLAPEYSWFRSVKCWNNRIYCVAASPSRQPAVLKIHPDSGEVEVLRGGETPLAEKDIAYPKHIRYPVGEAEEAYGFFYPPHNHAYDGNQALPPLIVTTHGGPTASSYPVLNLKIQYWTQRGFAVVDLNYRGSAGYGRNYRQKLYSQWGVSDVEDCLAASQYLAKHNMVDPKRVFIRGNSAGGYTTLCALTFTDHFRGGASLYGISDPAALMKETHKFESHYLEWLIGDTVDDKARYSERTPLLHAENIRCPMIFFQGEDDPVVVAEQTTRMVDTLKKCGTAVDYHLFPGEKHGFRQAKNQQVVLEEELRFYQALL